MPIRGGNFALRTRPRIRRDLWHGSPTTPHAEDSARNFRVTHPFHPWCGRQFEFVDCRLCWGEWRVFYYTEDGQVAYFPSAWTDVGQADPFVILSAGRAVSRFEDLVRLVKLIEDLKASTVKEIRPDV